MSYISRKFHFIISGTKTIHISVIERRKPKNGESILIIQKNCQIKQAIVSKYLIAIPMSNQGSIIFNTTKNQPFSTVNFGSKGTYKIANVISVVNNQFQELPIIPAKLLNLDKIAENRDVPICFTDSLELARVAPQALIGPCIFTSYYGAQFDGFEIDFYPFRDRTVYYVIVEHSGLTREQVMDRVHANYLQMKAQVKNINLNFVELNGFRKEEDSWHFSMQRISEQNFCERYFSLPHLIK